MKTMRILTVVLAAAGLLVLAAPANAQRRGRGMHPPFRSFNHGNFHRGGNVNFFFGGFAPFYGGYPFWGYSYWGYPYGYYYPPYPPPVYYAPQGGVYQGRMANPPRTTNESGKDVSMTERVQQHLARLGYYRGSIDGVIGDETRTAIRRYQRANGLAVDGHLDSDLLNSMGLG